MFLFNVFQHKRLTLPLHMQTAKAECGISCIAMIADYYGRGINIDNIRRMHPVSAQGLTVKQIVDIANETGLDARVLKLELGQLIQLRRPAVLHWNFNHFVILATANARNILIHDPAKGRCKLTWSQVAASFTGIAIELYPSDMMPPLQLSAAEKADNKITAYLRSPLSLLIIVALLIKGLFIISLY